jgi:hypothetical protein
MTRAVIAAALASVLLAGCGGNSDAKANKPAHKQQSASATASPSYDPAKATDSEKWAEFQRLLDVATAEDVNSQTEDEAPSIAKNLCDNDTHDMRNLLQLANLANGKSKQAETRTAYKIFARAYCPDEEDVLDQAAAAEDRAARARANRPKAKFWIIGLKIRSKECFGSAGCNVEYQINPQYWGSGDLHGSWDVTYKVTGGDDGPIINTFTVKNGRASFDADEFVSTASSTTKLHAKAIRMDAS